MTSKQSRKREEVQRKTSCFGDLMWVNSATSETNGRDTAQWGEEIWRKLNMAREKILVWMRLKGGYKSQVTKQNVQYALKSVGMNHTKDIPRTLLNPNRFCLVKAA
jgi:hypothetical protein